MQKKTMNMTEGNITKLLLAFAIPMLLGNLFSQLYSIVDSIIVGRFVGPNALAAIGTTTPMILIMIAILIGLNVGVTVVLSQYFGAQNDEMLRNAFANSIYISSVVAIVMAVVSFFISRQVLILMRTPEELLDGACTYLYISFLFCIMQMLFHLFGSAFRALGDSRTPVLCLVVSSVLNIILDLVFVICFHWGIAGVAWATGISQTVSMLMEAILLHRYFPILQLKKENYRLRGDVISKIMKLAIPMALQNSFNSLASVFVQVSVNQFGTNVIAAYSAATRIGEFAMQPMNTIGNAISVFVGQNFGAKNMARIRDGVKKAVLLAFETSLVVAFFLILCGGFIAGLFVETGAPGYEEIILNVKQYLYVASVPCFFAGYAFVYEYSLRGLGDGAAPMLAGIVELIIKVGVAYVAAFALNSVIGMWFAWPASYAVSGLVAMLRYCYYIRRKEEMLQNGME